MIKLRKIIPGLAYGALSMAAAYGMFHISFAVTFMLAYGESFKDSPLLEAVTLVPIHLALFAFPGVLPFVFGMKFKLYLLPAFLCVLAYLEFLYEFADFHPDASTFEQLTTITLGGRWMLLAFFMLIALRAAMRLNRALRLTRPPGDTR